MIIKFHRDEYGFFIRECSINRSVDGSMEAKLELCVVDYNKFDKFMRGTPNKDRTVMVPKACKHSGDCPLDIDLVGDSEEDESDFFMDL